MASAAGRRVSRTGVYRVTHLSHREPHQATLRKGESFPTCSICGTAVTFDFVEPLGKLQPEHIGYDADFVDSVLKRPKSA